MTRRPLSGERSRPGEPPSLERGADQETSLWREEQTREQTDGGRAESREQRMLMELMEKEAMRRD